MPETNEKVLLQINLDVGQINDALVEVKTNLTSAKSTLGELKKAFEVVFATKNEKAIEQVSEQIVLQEALVRKLSGEQKNLQKQLDLNTKANEAQKGSYEQLLRNYQLAEIRLKTLAGTLKQNEDGTFELTEEYKRQAVVVGAAKEALDRFNLTVNDGRSSVGQYGKALQPLKDEVRASNQEHQALTKTMAGVNSLLILSTQLTGENSKGNEVLQKFIAAVAVAHQLSNVQLGFSNSQLLIHQARLKATTVATNIQAVAQRVLNAVMAANPYVLIVTALTALAAALFLNTTRTKETQKAIEDTDETILDSKEKLAQLKLEYQKLTGAITDTEIALIQLGEENAKRVKEITDATTNEVFDNISAWEKLKAAVAATFDPTTVGEILLGTEAVSNGVDLLHKRLEANEQVHQQQITNIEKQEQLKRAQENKKAAQDKLDAFSDQMAKEIEAMKEQEKLAEEAFNAVRNLTLEEFVDRQIPITEAHAKMEAEITEDARKNAEERKRIAFEELQFKQNLAAAENDVNTARVDLVRATSAALRQNFKQDTGVYKAMFVVEKGAAIAEIILALQTEIARIAAANALLGAAGIPLTAAQSAAAKIRAATSIATIFVQSIPGLSAFAHGGLSGKRIGSGDGVPISRGNGDNLLATVRSGEVILNERQQAALGGAGVFAAIGVPGFKLGGLLQSPFSGNYNFTQVPAYNDGGFAARYAATPVTQSVTTANLTSQAVVDAIRNMKVVVLVSDINEVQGKVATVEGRANI